MLRHAVAVAALAAVGAILATALAATASARTFTVTMRGDPVPNGCKPRDCSLREAVLRANARAGRDVVVLPNRHAPYVLRQTGSGERGGDLDVSDRLLIRHPGGGKATIDARRIDRALDVRPGARTRLLGLAIRRGRPGSGEGGGIRAINADLVITRSRIAGNRTAAAEYGGGIGLVGSSGLRLVRSVVARNVSRSDGGGIDAAVGRVVIARSRIIRNRASRDGGAMFHVADEPSRVVASTIDRNRAGSDGGGIHYDPGGGLRLARTTISRNRAGDAGGGVASDGALNAVNVTIALNRSGATGGGLVIADSNARVRLNAVTIARNVADADGDGGSGGGIHRALASRVRVESSLIALNRLGSGGRNECAGQPFDSRGGNVLSTRGPAGDCEGFTRPTDRVRGNPRVGGLRRNGGPTETIALRPGSIAINRAKRGTAPRRDQRGAWRGRRKDVGAFERRVGR